MINVTGKSRRYELRAVLGNGSEAKLSFNTRDSSVAVIDRWT